MTTDWQSIITAVVSGPVAILLFKGYTERKAAKLANSAEEGKARSEERREEIRMLPDMMDRYVKRIETLEHEIREQTGRMEREAMRMRNYIGLLHYDYSRAFHRAYLCDTVLKGHVADWVQHTLPAHDSIPDFSDPKP